MEIAKRNESRRTCMDTPGKLSMYARHLSERGFETNSYRAAPLMPSRENGYDVDEIAAAAVRAQHNGSCMGVAGP